MLADLSSVSSVGVVRTVWSGDCLKVQAHGHDGEWGEFHIDYYRVELDGGETLYRSRSYSAVQNFLKMLTEPYQGMFVA